MKSVTAEVATLADAVSRAARVSPVKGAAYDKAQGLYLELRPSSAEAPLSVRATDLEVTYHQRISVLEIGDEDANWRIPAPLIAGILGGLPMGAGSKVRLAEKDGYIHVRSGKRRAKLRPIASDFPLVPWFDPNGMETVTGFPSRVSQVAWATEPEHDILSGVHIDGEYLYGCDRHKLAMVPCEVPIEKPITVPMTALAPLLRNVTEVKLRAAERRLELMPDADTQMTSTILAGAYPDVKRVMRDDFSGSLKVNRERLIDSINGMLVLVKNERYPVLAVTITEGSMRLRMEVADVGVMADELEVDGGDDMDLHFAPTMLLGALAASPREIVTLKYGPSPLNVVELRDDAYFDSFLMPMRPATAAAAA